MERVLRTLRVDGHEVAVVEVMDEEGPAYLLRIDERVVDEAPIPSPPTDAQISAAVDRWSRRR